MARQTDPFGSQRSIRGPWRRYIDGLAEHRPALLTYCHRLTGDVWEAEDLVQDTLIRVFSLLGKTDAQLDNAKAYLIRTASNLWIDRIRRATREQATLALEQSEITGAAPPPTIESRDAVQTLLQTLHPQERAAILMKEVFGLSLEETAAMLQTTVGAVKSALSRARGRLANRKPSARFDAPPRELVERFMRALRDKDMESLRAMCAEHVVGELVGGAEAHSFDQARRIFQHAHMEMPKLGFGLRPWWKVVEYSGEPMIAGFRTLDGVEGLNEIHRIQVENGKIVRVRTYCFCPETLAVVAEALGVRVLPRPHRSPSIGDVIRALLGFRARWRTRPPQENKHSSEEER
jgi:RNA polymerase sigma-70 factor, ECF subfamily